MMYKNIKIFPIQYLQYNDLSDDDIHYIFDTKSLKYSFKLYFASIAKHKKLKDINIEKTLLKHNYSKLTWTKQDFEQAINALTKVYQNIYSISKIKAYSMAEGYVIFNGIKVKNNKFFD